MALSHARVSLVLEKRYDAITVQDLLDRAEVGRSTFYSHYRGKDDLLLRSFEGMLDRFDQRLPLEGGRTAAVRELFEHVNEYRHFYQAMRRARILDRQWQVAIERLSGSIERRLLARDPATLSVPASVAAQALAGALCALLRWWVETDTPYSAAQMDEMYHRISRLNSSV
jgi:AcrR family transcriptional regulator